MMTMMSDLPGVSTHPATNARGNIQLGDGPCACVDWSMHRLGLEGIFTVLALLLGAFFFLFVGCFSPVVVSSPCCCFFSPVVVSSPLLLLLLCVLLSCPCFGVGAILGSVLPHNRFVIKSVV